MYECYLAGGGWFALTAAALEDAQAAARSLGASELREAAPAICCYCGGANPDAPNGVSYQCVHCGETFTASAV